MSIKDDLNSLYTIKNNLKAALKEKGLVTDTTPFSNYPSAMANLIAPVQTVTLTIKFSNKLYTQTTSGSRAYYATGTSGKEVAYLKVNGVDYYSELLGQKVTYDSSQYDRSISVEVPQNTKITVEAYMLLGTSRSKPLYRRYYSENLYTSKPDTQTFNIYNNKTITFTARYDDEAYKSYS